MWWLHKIFFPMGCTPEVSCGIKPGARIMRGIQNVGRCKKEHFFVHPWAAARKYWG
jgi:hypothetical protein